MRTRLTLSLTLLWTLIATLVIVTLTSARADADGWYFTEGVGSGTLEDQLGNRFEADFGMRVALGRRMDQWAIEGFMTMTDLSSVEQGNHALLVGYGLSARYIVPVTSHIELYARGGLHKLSLDMDMDMANSRDRGYQGRAIHYGAGAQLKGKVPALGFLFYPFFFTDLGPKVTAALWLETNQQYTRLHRDRVSSIDARLTTLSLGFAVGSDF